MARLILLDAGVVGQLCSDPSLPGGKLAMEWLTRQINKDVDVLLTDLTDYEVRRELVRLKAVRKLARLEQLRYDLRPVSIMREAWDQAAEFWSITRRAGRPTADPHALDGDAILAGVAATIGSPGDIVTIATTNVGHLIRFPGIDARRCDEID